MIKSVIWASMLDYPGQICTTLFFSGCNFDCEYCYNKSLSKLDSINFERQVLPKLLERKEVVNHVILSGGECTISNDFQIIIDTLYDKGFIVGIHTNGSRPDIILKNINKISFIGMDIKNDFDNYNMTCKIDVDIEKIKKSIEIIVNSNIDYEFRTTIYPKEINKENCVNIAKSLKEVGVTDYFLQNYNEVEASDTKPLQEKELQDILISCNNIIYTTIKNI